MLELRMEGRTEREIAAVVGVAPSTVHADLLAALGESVPTATAQEWQALVLERLERTMAPWWALAIAPDAVVVTLRADGETMTRPATTAERAGAVGLIARLLPELRRWSGVERWLDQTSQRPEPEAMPLEAVERELAEITELLCIQP